MPPVECKSDASANIVRFERESRARGLAHPTPFVDERLEIASLIDTLRSGEGACVSLFCDEPTSKATCMVTVTGRWTEFRQMEFRGPTVLFCLRAAKAAMDDAADIAPAT